MKKIVCIILAVAMGMVSGCSSKEPQETPPPMYSLAELTAKREQEMGDPTVSEKTPSQETQIQGGVNASDLYAQVLLKYVQAMREGWDRWQLQDAGLNYQCSYLDNLSDIGFNCVDIDGDGVEELLVGFSPIGGIFDLYTVTNGHLVLLMQGTERSSMDICSDGTIATYASYGAAYHENGYFKLNEGELSSSQWIIYDGTLDEDNPQFYSATSNVDKTPISEELADQIISSYENMYVNIPLTPLSQLVDSSSEESAQTPTYTQELSVTSSGSTAVMTLRNWDNGQWNDIFTASACIGSNGVSTNKQEGDRCTPAGTFDIMFAFGTAARSLNIDYYQIQPGDVWVCDSNSIYYNTLQENDNYYKDWDQMENLYDKFAMDRSVACIYFNFNGDGQYAGSAQSNCGSDLFIDGIGSAGNLTSGYGDIKISASDMVRLLELLDSSRNPRIVIS